MSINPNPDFAGPFKRDDIEVLANILARVPNVPPMHPAFRDTVREVARLRGSDSWACVQFVVARSKEYSDLWNGIYFEDPDALRETARMGVGMTQLRLCVDWLHGVYREVSPTTRKPS